MPICDLVSSEPSAGFCERVVVGDNRLINSLIRGQILVFLFGHR